MLIDNIPKFSLGVKTVLFPQGRDAIELTRWTWVHAHRGRVKHPLLLVDRPTSSSRDRLRRVNGSGGVRPVLLVVSVLEGPVMNGHQVGVLPTDAVPASRYRAGCAA